MAVTTPRIFHIRKSGRTPYDDPRPMKMVLGGKGAGLYQMAEEQINVPPLFTVTTDVCNEYRKAQDSCTLSVDWFEALMADIIAADKSLYDDFGYQPLVSVRSGAPVSMPGMMDTILNVGLTDTTVEEWSDRIGDRAAWDSYRRLIQMLGSTAYGVPHSAFETKLAEIKAERGVTEDIELTTLDLVQVANAYKQVFQAVKQQAFPQTREVQLRSAVVAVFDSWMNPRAIEYRKINKIDEEMGTAVNVQAMVFGNMGSDSGSGVLFTRNPSTGERAIMAEYLPNAQGEDVVAGIRTPLELDLASQTLIAADGIGMGLPKWGIELRHVCDKLEAMYRDMVDLEFTVQRDELFILQSRVGKRSAKAAFKIAVDLVNEDVVTPKDALSRLTTEQFKAVSRPIIDPSFKEPASQKGLPACPGVVTGKPVFSAEEAVDCDEPCILITHETTPEDIKGMAAAIGVLTQTGGATSHAAVVARAMDKACVVGCTGLNIDAVKGSQRVTIDGATGRVWFDIEVPVVSSADDPAVLKVMEWCFYSTSFAVNVPAADFDQYPGPQMIRAVDWWGDYGMMNVVLEDLMELTPEQRSLVTLDLRPEHQFLRSTESELFFAFGLEDKATVDFQAHIVATLMSVREKLVGLTLYGVPTKFLESGGEEALAGLPVIKQASTLAELFQGKPVLYSADVMANLVGDMKTFQTIVAAMEKYTCQPIKNVPTAVNPMFVIFDRLRRVS